MAIENTSLARRRRWWWAQRLWFGRTLSIALPRPTERQPLRDWRSFDGACRRRSDVVRNMGRVPKQSNKAIKSLSGHRQDPGQPSILADQSWCHDLTRTHLDEYKVVYDEFVEAVESEEAHRHSHSNTVTIPYSAVLRKAWDSGSMWYTHALTSQRLSGSIQRTPTAAFWRRAQRGGGNGTYEALGRKRHGIRCGQARAARGV